MKLDDLILWLLAWGGSLAFAGARMGFILFGLSSDPPDDPKARDAWERKRRWLIISELSALPAFASLAMVVGRMRDWPIEGIILFSMILGAVGFAFFLDALQAILRRRLGLTEKSGA
ncbi:MAG TPA: hypothetical protein VIG90_06670 [Pedomonas sp.]|uniref:hypothetical protein n=1 Tax=Pedomonas sp. TaxID=2976421 RepID=UPI002F3F701A